MDVIESSEIMELLRASYVDLDDPKRYQMIVDIVKYFSGRKDKRITILKILTGKPTYQDQFSDAVDIVWNWVQLTQERSNKIRGLPKEQFTGDIQKEIENEYLTRDNIKILKSQLGERISEGKKKEELAKEKKEEEREIEKGDKATEKAVSTSQLQEIQKKVEEVEQINKELEKY